MPFKCDKNELETTQNNYLRQYIIIPKVWPKSLEVYRDITMSTVIH